MSRNLAPRMSSAMLRPSHENSGLFMLMEEIWKDFPGYEGLYQVSTMGRVRSLNFNKRRGYVKLRNLCQGNHGYLYVMLSKNNIQRRFSVHRMVAITFIPKVKGKDFIDHINGDQSDNRVENLRWCTVSENINNPITIQRLKNVQHNPLSPLCKEKISKALKGSGCIPIAQYLKNGDFIREWECAQYAAEYYGFSASNITACCRGRLKSAYGFLWKYKTDYEQEKKNRD